MSHVIGSGRVFLRPFEPSDAALYQRWRSHEAVARLASFTGPIPSVAAIEQRIERVTREQGTDLFTFLICLATDAGRPIGEATLFHLDRDNGSAELGIFIGEPEEWSKGYGTDAVTALVGFGFGELRLERIWLEVWTENARARRAYEKVGFVHEGTLRHDRYEGGAFTDGDLMSILRHEWFAARPA
jgi:RimJ/RimL family protein N-acetyltransferase